MPKANGRIRYKIAIPVYAKEGKLKLVLSVRDQRILHGIDVENQIGLELGPLTAPILTKDKAKVFYVDHVSTEELKKKYASESLDPTKIVEVDYALGDQTLRQAVGPKKFDYVVASHVAEHVPDLVGWLKEIGSILRMGGVVSLIIPDKRFTFDITRYPSTPGDVIGAYLDKQSRPSSATMYDFASEFRLNIDSQEAWRNQNIRDYQQWPRRYSADEAYDMTLTNLKPDTYVDCHTFVLTPYHFVEALRVMIHHDLLDFEVSHFMETQPGELEFYVSLRKVDPKKTSRQQRIKSLPQVQRPLGVDELSEEIAELKRQISKVYASRSWRVTKPLRSIMHLLKKRDS